MSALASRLGQSVPRPPCMTMRRVLTVTVATGVCLLGSTLPAQAASPGPWKSTAYRGTTASEPVAGPVAPAAPSAPAATVVDPAAAMAAQIANIVNNERAAV